MKKRIIILIIIISIITIIFILYKNNNSFYCEYKPKLYYQYNNQKIYINCINNVEFTINNKSYELKEYLNNNSLDSFIDNLSIVSSLYDGGTTIYNDSNSKIITNYGLTLIKCNTIDGNRDIYIGDKDMKYQSNYCKNNNDYQEFSKNINEDIINKISHTNKIIIKQKSKNNILGTITNKDTINEIIDITKNAYNNDNISLCDGYGFELKMFQDNKLLETIYFWHNSERILPSSISNGCLYYHVNPNTSIKKIIENNSNYKFYTIFDYSETCDNKKELIYEDTNYKYYLKCAKNNQIFIEFQTTNKKTTLKEALDKKEISIDEILNSYSDLLIKNKK